MKKGIYKHYKGNNYEVIDTAMHTETEETLVIYKALYETKFGKDVLWARPMKMFTEHVHVDGKDVPRFDYIGKGKA